MNTTNFKKSALFLFLGAQLVGLSSCGVGSKIVKGLDFKTENVGGTYYTGFDAVIDLNGLSLPTATLPIYAPKNKSITIGELKIDANTIGVRVDLKSALKVDVLDGTKLPNGRPVPVTLPTGVLPIAFPIGGTNSKLYLAVSSETLMAGVAVTFKDDGLPDFLKQSLNAFFKFTIANNLTGNVGLFSGDAFGLGLFAVKTMGDTEKSAIGLSSASRIGKMSNGATVSSGKIDTQETSLSNRQRNRLMNAVEEVEVLQLQ